MAAGADSELQRLREELRQRQAENQAFQEALRKERARGDQLAAELNRTKAAEQVRSTSSTSRAASAASFWNAEKQQYANDVLMPLLAGMCSQCILHMPPDPKKFMVDYLEDYTVAAEDAALTSDERRQLEAEIAEVEAKLRSVRSQIQDVAHGISKGMEVDDDEDEEDDDVEPPPGFEERSVAESPTKARGAVSAEASGDWNSDKEYFAPVVPKTEEQNNRLRSVMSGSFLFSALDERSSTIVIGAMQEVRVTTGQRVIRQGDEGDFLFVIESGRLDCVIMADGIEKVVKTCVAGEVFGELAVLYNCARAASVDACEDSVLWQLDRNTFNHIVKDAAVRKRERYDNFLANVPLLANSDAYERSQIADALVSETFPDGANIVTQGEAGKKLYIIEEGDAVATKNGAQVMVFSTGDYFGELALLRNEPRAATVTAKGTCKLLSLGKSACHRLLNVHDLLERSQGRYK